MSTTPRKRRLPRPISIPLITKRIHDISCRQKKRLSRSTYQFFTNLKVACAPVTRHVDAKKQFPRRRWIPSGIGIRNARRKMGERRAPLPRRTLEVQLECELDFARIARSARIGT